MSKTVSLLALVGLAASANAAITIQATNTAYSGITGLGNFNLLTGNGDDVEHNITAAALAAAGFNGNSLLAGGVPIRVGNNGAVLWNATTGEIGYTNGNILTMTGSNATNTGNGMTLGKQFVCALWDDFVPAATASGVTTRLGWAVVGGNLIIEWNNEDLFPASTLPNPGVGTFQMIVYGGYAGGMPLVDFVYEDTLWDTASAANDGASASIGYKNTGGPGFANDLQYSTNTAAVSGWTSGVNQNLTHAVRIIPAPGALALLGLGGLIVGRRRR